MRDLQIDKSLIYVHVDCISQVQLLGYTYRFDRWWKCAQRFTLPYDTRHGHCWNVTKQRHASAARARSAKLGVKPIFKSLFNGDETNWGFDCSAYWNASHFFLLSLNPNPEFKRIGNVEQSIAQHKFINDSIFVTVSRVRVNALQKFECGKCLKILLWNFGRSLINTCRPALLLCIASEFINIIR